MDIFRYILYFKQTTNFLEHISSLEVSSCLAGQEVHHCVYKNPSRVTLLCQLNPAHTFIFCFLKIRLSIVLPSKTDDLSNISFTLHPVQHQTWSPTCCRLSDAVSSESSVVPFAATLPFWSSPPPIATSKGAMPC